MSDDAKCYSVFPSSHDLVYLQNSSSFPKLILVKTDHPAYTHCWSSRGIQGHWPSSSLNCFWGFVYILINIKFNYNMYKCFFLRIGFSKNTYVYNYLDHTLRPNEYSPTIKIKLEGQWPWIPRELQQCVYAGWSVFTKINFGNDELFCE